MYYCEPLKWLYLHHFCTISLHPEANREPYSPPDAQVTVLDVRNDVALVNNSHIHILTLLM